MPSQPRPPLHHYEVGDCVRVELSRGGFSDELITRIDTGKDAYPWEDRVTLRTVYLKDGEWKQTWRHACDPGVRPEREAEHLIGSWVEHVLVNGEEPYVA